ncbi:MAG TPA: lipopolysaccharide biosynthesis protein [Blastocatellia bacterium]|nr:lipopolysaccharide biosynthesis protein [Blastocatellia bacterium]
MSESTPEKYSLTTMAAWSMIARTLAFACSFALPLLLVRRLSRQEFGLYKQVFLLALTAINTLPLGIDMSAYYFLPRESKRKGHVVLNILLFYFLTTIASGFVLYMFPQILHGIFGSDDLIKYSALIAILIPLWGLPFVLENIAYANEEAKLASAFVVVSEFSKAVVLIGATLWFGTLRALIYAAIIHGLVQAVISFVYFYSAFGSFWKDFDWSVMRRQLVYILPFGLAAVLLRFQTDLHSYFVSHRFSAADFAVYSVGCFNLPLLSILSSSVGAVMIPRVSRLQVLGQLREIVELVARMMRKMAAIYFPLYVFLIIVRKEFITILFTKQYASASSIFVLNLSFIPLGLLVSANDAVIRAYPEHRSYLVKLRAALIPGLLFALWFCTAHFGLIGAISVVVAAASLEAILMASKLGRTLGVAFHDIRLLLDVGKLAVASVIAGIIATVVHSLLPDIHPIVTLAISGTVFSIAYAILVLVLGVVSLDERESLRRYASSAQRFIPWRKAEAH